MNSIHSDHYCGICVMHTEYLMQLYRFITESESDISTYLYLGLMQNLKT